ncbi:MAG: hypothetical protein EXS08_01775 [Planctomycetes bacterium]|nr:hypothetical protein [Planctomycetota bacterium]
MSLRSSVALAALALGACQPGSSSPRASSLPSVTNLGLAVKGVFGSDVLRVVTVPEDEQGTDVNGDGDTLDDVIHVLDLEHGTVINTGLVLGSSFPRGEFQPSPVLAVGTHVAFAVNEFESGALDRNGDGDTSDLVLALYDRDSGNVLNQGLAVSRLLSSERLLALSVPEFAQGEQDLDGDGTVDVRTSVPFVHDLVTRETWNTGLRDATLLAVDERYLAVAVVERAGDLNGDGDALDTVCELYDTTTRSLVNVGLALPVFFGLPSSPTPLRGWWRISVSEAGQGASDLNGDGDASDTVAFLFEPETGLSRNLRGLDTWLPQPEVGPFVLEARSGPPGFLRRVELYDPLTDRLEDTGFAAQEVLGLGARLALGVAEDDQGEDLDGDGALASWVPVLYDPATGAHESLGVEGSELRRVAPGLMFISRELAPAQDWNGDGDLEDVVLQSWDEHTGARHNSRLALRGLSPFGADAALVLLSEADATTDWNGDGDLEDNVLQVYDLATRRTHNLGLAGFALGDSAITPALVLVFEDAQQSDLNGDGDQLDLVLFRVAR